MNNEAYVTLQVTAYKGLRPVMEWAHVFDENGGVIGRDINCDLVLFDPDKYISRQHAFVEYNIECKKFFLRDKSTEGTCIKNIQLELHNNTVELTNGDTIKIGDYDLTVQLTLPEKKDEEENRNYDPSTPIIPQDNNTIITWTYPLDEPIIQPEVQQNHPELDHLLKKLLSEIGLPEHFMQGKKDLRQTVLTMGILFREMVNGMIQILQGRREFKRETDLDTTVISGDNNNPLKFSDSVLHTLELLLINKAPGYMDSEEALREAFSDLENHQLALSSGMYLSLMSALKRFDPKLIEQKYSKSFNKNAKCWDEYAKTYEQIVEEAISHFFGAEFKKGYEEQIKRLNRTRNID